MKAAYTINDLRARARRSDALRAGLPLSTFYEWKDGKVDLSADQLVKLAYAVGLRVRLVPTLMAREMDGESPARKQKPATPASTGCPATIG